MFLRLPVAKQPLHVAHAFGLALDEDRLVADRLLLLVDRADLRVHHFGADLHVADRVIAVGLGVALPDRHAVRHQLAHRRLVVVVAHDAARDAGRAGTDGGLVEHHDVGAAALPTRLQLLGQMVGGAPARGSGADHQIFDASGEP